MGKEKIDLIWECSNSYSSQTKYVTGTSVTSKGSTGKADTQGVCAGLAALWCRNMLDGARALASKPDLDRAMILQAHYHNGRASKLFDFLDIEENGSHLKGTYKEVGEKVAADHGVYFLALVGTHALAAMSSNKLYYFFDPNYGLYTHTNPNIITACLIRSARELNHDESKNAVAVKLKKKKKSP